jgi:oligopeptide transport system substrate-binding protein
MKRVISIILAVTILLTCCCACGKKAAKNADKTINYNFDYEPKTLDPQIVSDYSGRIAVEALYEGLARLDANEKPYPGVAEKWEANSDYTVFTFTLRKNAKWSATNSDKSNDPVTADDFVFAFQRALSPATKSGTCSSMFCIKNAKEVNTGALSADKLGVTAKDAHTLVVQLAYSYEDFPALTATAPFMPCNKKFFNSTSGKYGLEVKTVCGNGPFKINGSYSWDHGNYLKLIRSGSYSGSKTPLPASLNFTIGNNKDHDVSNPIAALTKKTVDVIAIPATSLGDAEKIGCTTSSFEDTTWGLCFNTSDKLMKSSAIRKAFVQTLDRNKVLSHLPEHCKTADDIITPKTTFMGSSYRKAAGSALFAKADANAVNGLPAALKALSLEAMPSVAVLGPDDSNVKLMLNEMLTDWNAKMGNYFNMTPLSQDGLATRVITGDYQIALYPIRPNGDGPKQLLSQFQSTSNSNPAFLKDSNYDKLLIAAETQSGKDALASYTAAEKYLNDQFIFYPIYYENRYFAYAKGVTGVIIHPYDAGIDFIQAGKED